MGRDITGVRTEHKSQYAKVKPKVSAHTDGEISPKSPEGNNEVKDCEVKECTSEVPRAETSPEKQAVLSVKSTNFDDQKASSPIKPASGKNNTFQKISEGTVDKEVCESPIAIETPVSPTPRNSKSPSSSRKSQLSTPFVTRKNFMDEDGWSMTSSAASARTTKSRITTGVAPTFASEERIEKRKEYYAKLEEKRKALEAEKQEYEARTKEEDDAVIKQLRKSMTYKANPVPNFYYVKQTPKKDLKKLPTTRAVSPKFGRRKSCSDAVNLSVDDKVSVRGRALRHSVGSHTQHSTPTSTPKRKDLPMRDRSNLKPVKETINKSSSKISEQMNVDIAVQS